MHKYFFHLFFVSLAGVLLAAKFSDTSVQWLGLGAGLAPLIVYHFILFREKTVSATEVDSIYYFGFLVTVVTLVVTALSIGLKGGSLNVSSVLVQFALGLVATGYALFARLHLLTKLNSQDVVDATEKLAKSVEKVAGEFDRAGHHVTAFVDLTQQRMTKMERTLQLAENTFESKLNTAALAFNDALAQTAANSLGKTAGVVDEATRQFSSSISSVMDEIGRIQNEAEAISFARAAERIDIFSQSMESSIGSITSKVAAASDDSASAIAELTASARKTQKLTEQIAQRLGSLGKIETLLSTIEKTAIALEEISKTASATSDSISSLGEKLGQAEEEVRKNLTAPLSSIGLSEALKNTIGTLGQLEGAASSLLSSISDQTKYFNAFAPELFRQVRGTTGETLSTFDSLNAALISATSGLNSIGGKVSALEELGPAAALAVHQLKALAVSASQSARNVSSSQGDLPSESHGPQQSIAAATIG